MATLFAGTIQDVLDTISDYRGETSTNTDAKRIRAVSRSEQSIAKRTTWNLYYLPDQTITTDGSSTYTIGSASYPLRYRGLVEVFVDGTLESDRHQLIEADEFRKLYNDNNADQLCYVTYDPANDAWELTISPTPETSKTITYSYYWIPPKRTAVSNPVVCVDMEALARMANAELYDSEDEPEKAAMERNKAEQILTEEIGTDDAPNPNQTYSQPGNTQGLGTY